MHVIPPFSNNGPLFDSELQQINYDSPECDYKPWSVLEWFVMKIIHAWLTKATGINCNLVIFCFCPSAFCDLTLALILSYNVSSVRHSLVVHLLLALSTLPASIRLLPACSLSLFLPLPPSSLFLFLNASASSALLNGRIRSLAKPRRPCSTGRCLRTCAAAQPTLPIPLRPSPSEPWRLRLKSSPPLS